MIDLVCVINEGSGILPLIEFMGGILMGDKLDMPLECSAFYSFNTE